MDLFAEAGASLEPLAGGWSGETFLADVRGERSVVRILAAPRHPPQAAEVLAALHRLVRGLVPVPEVREARRPDADAGTPGLLVTEFLPGVRGDLLLPGLDEDGLRRVGAATGGIAATLAGMPTLRPGAWADADLRIDPFHLVLSDWVDAHAARLTGWTPPELDGLARVANTAQDVLDGVDRTCVVHSDLNAKNLLVDPETLGVTGVLDWEYSHSGHPATDLGNLLRFDRAPAYVDAVLGAWSDRHGTTAAEALDLARSADLFALVDLAARAGAHPVADAAHDLLRAIARTGDVHALA
ncbi:MAG TPA: phosphotransferase [Nocardioides sp.]|nr:phosphotransferase [Nocardioides sp.]